MSTVRLRNINPLGDVEVPSLGRGEDNPLRAGEVFEVPAAQAGREPGTWREPTDAERALNLAGLKRREVGEAPHVRTEVRCPGVGLLAQVANYERVPAPAKSKAPKGAVTGQEK